MTHEQLREALPAFSLNALDAAEAHEVSLHIGACRECQRELMQLQAATTQLALGVAQVSPPPTLGVAILDRVRPSRTQVGRGWITIALSAAAVIILLFVALLVSVNQRLAMLQSHLAVQADVLTTLASPSAKTAVLAGSVEARVRLIYDPAAQRGALLVSALGDPGAGHVYQVWLITGTQPTSAGVFRPAVGETAIVPVNADFVQYQAVAISVERAPNGAPQPTVAPILIGR